MKGGHYQVACTRYFEATHKREVDSMQNMISHPNQYFEESRKLEVETPAGKSLHFEAAMSGPYGFFWWA